MKKFLSCLVLLAGSLGASILPVGTTGTASVPVDAGITTQAPLMIQGYSGTNNVLAPVTMTADGLMLGPTPLSVGSNLFRQQKNGVLAPNTSIQIGCQLTLYSGVYSLSSDGKLQFSPEWYFTPLGFGVSTANGVSYLFYGVGIGYSNFGVSFGWNLRDPNPEPFIGIQTTVNTQSLTRGLDYVFGAEKKFGVTW